MSAFGQRRDGGTVYSPRLLTSAHQPASLVGAAGHVAAADTMSALPGASLTGASGMVAMLTHTAMRLGRLIWLARRV